jgi:amidase
VTTAGSPAVARTAAPAPADAALLAGARRAGVRLVGKTNLHELAFGTSGVNAYYGTPANPFDPAHIPGGSSSGSAVAITEGSADIAYGSDTGGSIRVPSAFCGVTGLKTTHGRIGLSGVFPLAPSLDTVGPMAADVAGVVRGMALLEPGFLPGRPAGSIGRFRSPDFPADPAIDAALDGLLARSGHRVVEIEIAGWLAAYRAGSDLLVHEAFVLNRPLLEDPTLAGLVSAPVTARLREGSSVTAAQIDAALVVATGFLAELAEVFAQVDLLALPSVEIFPPRLEDAPRQVYNHLTLPVNLAGLPALALPVPTGWRFPASLQLVAPRGGEELLCATGAELEAARS